MQHYPAFITATIGLFLSGVCRADTWTGATSSSWIEPLNWQDGTVPTSADVVIFDALSTANQATVLNGPISIAGISLVDPSATISITGGTAGTLSIGNQGINLSTATQDLWLTLSGNNVVSFAEDQTFAIGTGRTVSFAGTASSFRSFDLGSHKLTKTGAGTVAFNAGLNLANGSFDIQEGALIVLANSSTNTTSPSSVSYKIAAGATLTARNDSGVLTFASPVEVNGGNLSIIGGGNHTVSGPISGTGGVVITALSSTGTVTKTVSSPFSGTGVFDLRNHITSGFNHAIVLSGNNSGFLGSFNVNGTIGQRVIRMGSASAGSASAAWSVAANNVLQISNVSVDLGDLTGAGTVTTNTGSGKITVGARNNTSTFSGVISGVTSVTKTGSGTWSLTGPNTYTGETIVNQGTLSLSNTFLADASVVSISSEGFLHLNHTGTDRVGELHLAGETAAKGVWGAIGSGAQYTSERITGTGFIQVGTAYEIWALQKKLTLGENDGGDMDPDEDGIPNLVEFAFDTNPLESSFLENEGKVVSKVVASGQDQILTITLPVRTNAVFSGTTERISTLADGIVYRIQAGVDLSVWDGVVAEVAEVEAAAIQSDLHLPTPLTRGWSYRTFRIVTPVGQVPKNFIRAKIAES